VTLHQACINLFPLTLSGKERALPFYPRSNRGFVFVTKPSRKQNLFFQNKFILNSLKSVTLFTGTIAFAFFYHVANKVLWEYSNILVGLFHCSSPLSSTLFLSQVRVLLSFSCRFLQYRCSKETDRFFAVSEVHCTIAGRKSERMSWTTPTRGGPTVITLPRRNGGNF
jgi:hypothetical protein